MTRRLALFWSTIGRKFVMAATGLLMVVFLIGHLSGNLLLFLGDPGPFNEYAHLLESTGWLLVAVEMVLLAFFLGHVIAGIRIILENRRARAESYQRYRSSGRSSKQTLSSKTMIWTGIVLFAFTALHLYTFKYGPGVAEGYVFATENGAIRDLYRLVDEVFQKPVYVIWYVAAMILLGFHLRHGFWSAFQSLGLHHPRWESKILWAGYLIAAVLGIGFLAMPLWIYLKGVMG